MTVAGGVDVRRDSVRWGGPAPIIAPSRYIDEATRMLAMLAGGYEDAQRTRLAGMQRELPERLLKHAKTYEDAYSRELTKALRRHLIWPWLSQFKGLGGVHTARLIGMIGDPRRFPGQRCTEHHTMVPDYAPGTPCPVMDYHSEESCPGTMLEPRPHSGVRSVWHYLGLHVVDGKMPRRRKGVQADWNPDGRTACLMPQGIADHIIMHRVEPYRGLYEATKARKAGGGVGQVGDSERSSGPTLLSLTGGGAEEVVDSEKAAGPTLLSLDGGGVEGRGDSDHAVGLRPIQIHSIARTVAVKRFVADLFLEWKELAGGVEIASDSENRTGPAPTTLAGAAE